MNWDEVSRTADVMGIITGVMAILGLGGILTWSYYGEQKQTFQETIWAVFGFSVRLFFALLLAIPELILAFYVFGFFVLLTGGQWAEGLWDSSRPVGYVFAYAIAGVPSLALISASVMSVLTWSLDPARNLIRAVIRRRPTDKV
jgi:hypothetical protein